MSKLNMKFVNKKGELLFEKNLSKQHIKELQLNSKFVVNVKKKTIYSILFDEMFKNYVEVQNLLWNDHKCTVCGKEESFLNQNGTVYCIYCYDMFCEKTQEHKQLVTSNGSVSNLEDTYTRLYKKPKQKRFNKNDSNSSKGINIEMIIEIDEKPKTSRLLKFQQKLEKSKELQKQQPNSIKKTSTTEQKVEKNDYLEMKDFYNITCLIQIKNNLENFENKLNELNKKYIFNILYIHHLLLETKQIIQKYHSIAGINNLKKYNQVTNNDVIFKDFLFKNKANAKIQQLDKMVEQYKIMNKLSSNQATIDVVLEDIKECQICSKPLNSNYQIQSLRKKAQLNENNIHTAIKVCNECSFLHDEYSILEIYALKSLNNERITMTTQSFIYLLTQYNYLRKKLNTILTTKDYQFLQREFKLYFDNFIQPLFKKLNIYTKSNLLNIYYIQEVIDTISIKVKE